MSGTYTRAASLQTVVLDAVTGLAINATPPALHPREITSMIKTDIEFLDAPDEHGEGLLSACNLQLAIQAPRAGRHWRVRAAGST